MVDPTPAEAAPTDCNGEPHLYAHKKGPYSPVFVGQCMTCGAIDWADLAEQVSQRIASAIESAGAGPPIACPSVASESTESAQTPSAAPIYPSAPEKPAESRTALRNRYADAIDRVLDRPNGWAYRGTLPDAVLAVRDDELAEARRRAAQADAALIAEVARTCGADLDAPRTHKELPNVAALALDAARDLRADYEQAVAQLDHAEAALAQVRSHCQQVAGGQPWEDYEIGRLDHARQVLALLDGAGAVPGEHTGGQP